MHVRGRAGHARNGEFRYAELTIDPASGEVLDVEIVELDADVTDVCDLIEEAADDDHDEW